MRQEERLLIEEVARLRGRSAPWPLNAVLALKLAGPLNCAALEDAINTVVYQKSVLRTRTINNPVISCVDRQRTLEEFAKSHVVTSGMYAQSIDPPKHVAIRNTHLPTAVELETDVCTCIEKDARQAFYYDDTPLIRAVLFRISSTLHVLVIIVPHLVADQFALTIMARTILTSYTSLIGSDIRQPHMPAEGVVSARVSDQTRTDQMRHWMKYWLAVEDDQFERVDLSARPQRSDPAEHYQLKSAELGSELTRGVRLLASAQQTSVHVVLRAGLAIALHLLTGRRQIVVWGNFANRASMERQHHIGWLNNRHIVAVGVGKNDKGGDVVRCTRTEMLHAIANQELSIQSLWQQLGRSLDHRRTFVLLDVTTAHRPRCYGDIVAQQLDLWMGAWRTADLTFKGVDAKSQVTLAARYAASRYSREAVSAMMRCWITCLWKLTSQPRALVADYRDCL